VTRLSCCCLALCLAAALRPDAAEAQSANAYRGLFGERTHKTTRQPVVDFTLAVVDGYDNASQEPGAEALPSQTREGRYSSVEAGVQYTNVRGQRKLLISAADNFRHEPDLLEAFTSSYDASAAYATPLWRSGRIDLSQGFAYSPFYQLELFPDVVSDAPKPPQAPTADNAISTQSSRTLRTKIGFGQTLGRRSSFRARFDRSSTMFEGGAHDLLTQSLSIELHKQATKYTGFHVGGAARQATYGGLLTQTQFQTQEVEFGIDYSKRRTTFTAAGGPLFVPIFGQTEIRAIGSASLRVELSRAWAANLQYNRALQFIEGAPEPFFSDAIQGGLVGQPARRLGLSASFGYSTGTMGLGLMSQGTYGTYTGSGQLTVPLTRHYALYSQYVIYHYEFNEQALVGGFPPLLDRQTVRFGLKLWFPLAN